MPPVTAQPPAPTETPIESPAGEERSLRDPGWDVVVWNDPITLMSYVVLVFRRLFGYDFETATRLMLQVHHQGKAVVATQPREQAEVSVSRLHGFGLQATLGRG
jgi:ATP-dependent Clp protease adaptor protein ClpS